MKNITFFLLITMHFLTLHATQTNNYSYWNVQALYGAKFNEPFNPKEVHKATATIENSSKWNWGNSFAFIDVVKSDSNDRNAVSIYGEWYPSASLTSISDSSLNFGIVQDISLTGGINVGRKSTGANPLVYLPGVTVDLTLPSFAFFNLGVYAYIDRGTINNGVSNGCHQTGFQITPSWLLPFSIGKTNLRFDGFLDYISSHGECSQQILTQPRITFDAGNIFGISSNHFYVGIEYQYWHNKFGIKNLDESFPQALLMYRF
jgi:nucleoside-specific outer membrane channel protein Tsx